MQTPRVPTPYVLPSDMNHNPPVNNAAAGQLSDMNVSGLSNITFSPDMFPLSPGSDYVDSNPLLTSSLFGTPDPTTWDYKNSPTYSLTQDPAYYSGEQTPEPVNISDGSPDYPSLDDMLFDDFGALESTMDARKSPAVEPEEIEDFVRFQTSPDENLQESHIDFMAGKFRLGSRSPKERSSHSSRSSVRSNRGKTKRPLRMSRSTESIGTNREEDDKPRLSRRKRKAPVFSGTASSTKDSDGSHPTPPRTTHNQIEKNYRQRLNCNFSKLLTAVTDSDAENENVFEDNDGSRMLSKSGVLNIARQRILALKGDNQWLRRQVQELKLSSKSLL